MYEREKLTKHKSGRVMRYRKKKLELERCKLSEKRRSSHVNSELGTFVPEVKKDQHQQLR
jgi:hypothetical protein